MQGVRTNRWGRIILEILPIFLMIACVVVDQITKFAFKEIYLNGGETIVIDGFFKLTYAENTGAAWSFLAEVSWGQTFFKILTGVALVAFVFMYIYAVKNNFTWLKFALALIIGGTIGNFIDRLFLGYVIDFLGFIFGDYHFPIFNLADSFLCVGVIMLIIHFLFLDESAVFKKNVKE